jgi:non-specific serine/threonine protein kinase
MTAGDIATLRFLLDAARRVTIPGAPGPWHRALATAAALFPGPGTAADFPDGTWLVRLGALTDGTLVPYMVARALGLPDDLGLSQLDALRTGLRGKRLLILLEDGGQVAEACADLAAELKCCPGIRLAASVMPSPERLCAPCNTEEGTGAV